VTRALFALLVFASGCAVHPSPPASPASDPVRVADGLRVPQAYQPTARVRLTANGVSTTQDVPANVPLAIAFCSTTPRWTALANADRWYAVTIDGAQRDHAGALTQLDANCFQTPKAYAFAPGTHDVAVALAYPPTQVVTCAPNDAACDNSCTPGQVCYGGATAFVANATAGSAGPPPSIVNGRILR